MQIPPALWKTDTGNSLGIGSSHAARSEAGYTGARACMIPCQTFPPATDSKFGPSLGRHSVSTQQQFGTVLIQWSGNHPLRRPEATPERPVTPQRQALAHSGIDLGQPSHAVGDSDGARLVWRKGAGRAARLGHCCVASLGDAPTPHALGPGARSPRTVRTLSLAVYGPDSGTRPDPGVICAAVRPGGDLEKGPCAFGPRDATAMERVGHRPHDLSPAGAVLDGDAVVRTVGVEGHTAGQAGGGISHTPAELCGGDRRSAPACGDLVPFSRVTYHTRYGGDLAHIAGTLDRYPLLRGVNG
jgi:hypothetical protein